MTRAPGLVRRMAAFVYEGVLLFQGCGWPAPVSLRAPWWPWLLLGLAATLFLFVVLGVYFIWFWTRGGQTVAMKAWHIRLLSADGAPVSRLRAGARYLLAWLWFLPALAWSYVTGVRSGATVAAALIVGVLAYAASSRLNRQRQYWHDLLSGTRLVQWRVAPRRQV